MNGHRLYAVGLTVLVAAATPLSITRAQTDAASGNARAHATIKDAHGKAVGEASFAQMAHGVLLRAELTDLPPGPHGFHIHAAGKCEPPGFTSAGGHLNPSDHKHGYNAAAGPHAGDLPNLIAGPDGKATVEVWIRDLSLGEERVASGTSTSGETKDRAGAGNLFGQAGTSIVVHAKGDDYKSDPAGNSGDRIACGVIER